MTIFTDAVQGWFILPLLLAAFLGTVAALGGWEAAQRPLGERPDLMALASDDGITLPEMKPVGQGYKDFSPALETFERMLLNGEIAHAGHKVLDWCMSNAVIEQDGAENRKLSKEKATGRIDLAVAAVMAAGLVNQKVESTDITQGFVLI